MRNTVASLLHAEMYRNKDIYLLTADLGFGLWDKIQQDYPTRFYNMGSAEQLMLGAAVGLTLSNKIAVCYSISPFIIWRPAEWIRNYLIHEHISVKLIGGGRGKDYELDGFTHWESEDIFPDITLRPEVITKEMFHDFLYNNQPQYLNLKR